MEDELKILNHLAAAIKAEGFSVFSAATVGEIESLLSLPRQRFEIIVLDRLLAGRDATPLIPRLKKELLDCRVLVLSAINTPSEKAAVLDMGADDYLSKPFAAEELIARIRALLRRNPTELAFGNVSLDPITRIMKIDSAEVLLTNKEFVLLKTLIHTPGKVFNKTHLYEQVWNMSPDVDSNVVEATINKLRRRFEECGAAIQIRNARNVGYWLEE